MRVEFGEDGAWLELSPGEYGFVFRCLSDRVTTLPEWEIEPRLGMSNEAVQALLDRLLVAERGAREAGNHWMPLHRGPESDG